ncbi:MAG TPA: protein kinase [Kofleriaceae bacterium]|jgi:serine/threonine-protein kinase
MSAIPAGAGQLLGKRLGKYEILALLALGGTAEIYLARIGGASGFEKYVVVKCLHDHLADDPEFVKMFLDEARLAAFLDHSNIVQTMELGEYENRYFMAMEFLAGLSLAMIVRRANERLPQGRLPVPIVLNILAQAAAGLHYAHEKRANGAPLGIVHRDISPQNLVISFEGVVKVVDFGIAKAELRETRTRSGTIKGKFAYMSPEQCVAQNVDRRTDVFALGVIGHELLTGRRLFKRASPYETYQAVIECDVKPPSRLEVELDPALDTIILRATAKDKEKRYQTAQDFGDALQAYMHQRGKGAGPSELARFFEGPFAQEIEEHAARMRELIAGREIGSGTGWGEDEKGGGEPSLILETNDIDVLHEQQRQSSSGLNDLLGALGAPPDEDDMPADRTRIEQNPMQKVNELERIANTPKPELLRAQAGTRPMPAQTPPGGRAPTAAGVPQPRASTQGGAGKLPPGLMAGLSSGPLDGRPAPKAAAPLAVPGPGPMPLGGPASPSLSPLAAPPSPLGASPLAGPPSGALPLPDPPPAPMRAQTERPRFPDAANLPTQIAVEHVDIVAIERAERAEFFAAQPTIAEGPSIEELQRALSQTAPPPLAHGTPSATSPANPALPSVSGLFATEPSMQDPLHAPTRPAPRPSAALLTDYPVVNAQMSAQIAAGATVFPDSGPGARPRIPQSGPVGIDAAKAASLMSPVGAQYPDQVDWAAAAAAPARAVPAWLLALIFIGAIGIALGLTIVIARLAH